LIEEALQANKIVIIELNNNTIQQQEGEIEAN
jgi:hypothetical protein